MLLYLAFVGWVFFYMVTGVLVGHGLYAWVGHELPEVRAGVVVMLVWPLLVAIVCCMIVAVLLLQARDRVWGALHRG